MTTAHNYIKRDHHEAKANNMRPLGMTLKTTKNSGNLIHWQHHAQRGILLNSKIEMIPVYLYLLAGPKNELYKLKATTRNKLDEILV